MKQINWKAGYFISRRMEFLAGADVWAACSHTMKAAERQESVEATRQRVRDLIVRETFGEPYVRGSGTMEDRLVR